MSTLLAAPLLQYLILALCALVVVKRATGIQNLGVDSWAPMITALEFLATGNADELFEVVFFERGIKFQYPPSSLLFLEPFCRLGMRAASDLNALNYIALLANALALAVLAGRLSADILSLRQVRTVRYGVFFVALFYEPIMLGYTIGQVQIVLNLLFTLSCIFLLSERGRGAGVMIGLATAFKPQFGPLLLVQLALKRWRFAGGFILAACLIGLVSLWAYGWNSHLSYLKVLDFLSQRGESFHLNESINGIAHRLLGNGSAFDIAEAHGIAHSTIPPYDPLVAALTRITTMLFLALPFAVLWLSRTRDELLMFSLASVCFVLASPIAWTHHYGILLPVYLLLLRRMIESERTALPGIVLFAVSFVLTGLRFPEFRNAEGWWTLLHAPVFFGACLLTAMLIFQLVADAKANRAKVHPSGAQRGT